MSKRIVRWSVIAVAVLGLVLFLLNYLGKKKEARTAYEVYPSLVTDIRELLRVTTLEGDRMIPVTLEEDGVGAFALGNYKVRISYDVERLETYQMGDTLLVRLPEEDVAIFENDRVGFRVFDVWGTSFWTRLSGVKLSIEQENRMRKMATEQLKKELHRDGSIKKARSQAIEAVGDMLSILPGTVIVLEPAEKMRPHPYPSMRGPLSEIPEKVAPNPYTKSRIKK